VIEEIGWEPTAPVAVDQAFELLRKLPFAWSDEIQPLVPRNALVLSISVSLTVNAAASPTVKLRGAVAVDGNRLVWSILDSDLEVIASTLRQSTAFAQFDIDCNQFVGPDARPISSSTSPLYGGAGPFIPGGIFRVAMVVTREGAPATFMRRPFANTPGSAVMPGVVLRAG